MPAAPRSSALLCQPKDTHFTVITATQKTRIPPVESWAPSMDSRYNPLRPPTRTLPRPKNGNLTGKWATRGLPSLRPGAGPSYPSHFPQPKSGNPVAETKENENRYDANNLPLTDFLLVRPVQGHFFIPLPQTRRGGKSAGHAAHAGVFEPAGFGKTARHNPFKPER